VTVRVKLEEVPPLNTEDPEVALDPPSPPPEPTGDEWWEGNGRSDPEEEEEEEQGERCLQETGNGVEGKNPSSPPLPKTHVGMEMEGSPAGVWILLSGDGFIFIPTQNGVVDPMTTLGFGALLNGGGFQFIPTQNGVVDPMTTLGFGALLNGGGLVFNPPPVWTNW
ncbi:hypothetical protein CIB84_016391, partial [Bambusicola thoracicus]